MRTGKINHSSNETIAIANHSVQEEKRNVRCSI